MWLDLWHILFDFCFYKAKDKWVYFENVKLGVINLFDLKQVSIK